MPPTDIFDSALSPLSPDIRDDPYPTYHALREKAAIARGAPGVWVLSRFAECAAVLQDPRFGHLEAGEEPANAEFGRLGDGLDPLQEPDGTPVPSFITLNPPAHTRIRKLLSQAFTVKQVQQLGPRIGRIVDGLLDDMLAEEEFDLLAEFSYPLSVTVISELLGVPPQDYELFCDWSADICKGLDPALMQQPAVQDRMRVARGEFSEYFLGLARGRREEPGADLLSAMVGATRHDDRMSDVELVVTSTLLLIAGHETTANLLGNSVLALLRNPAELEKLRGRPEVSASAVDELLRYDPPGQLASRVAREDLELDGVRIPRGDSVLALLGAANRDPARFAEPDRLDLDRTKVNHLSFGHGIHLCLGAQLARMEVRIALRKLIDRAPGLWVSAAPQWKPHAALRGMEALRLSRG